jgi:tyrosine-protein kinase Etk/Wzc
LSSNAQQALAESSKYNQQRVQNETQISLVTYLRDYINSPSNKDEVIPSNVGLEDQKLSTVIEQYNTLLSERKRLLLTSSEENPAVKKLDISLEAMRKGVQTTVASVLKGLQITRTDIERQANKFESRISQAPEQEKEFMSIARQQEIKATLYTMLLQKREENAITLAATANNGRIIEEALPDEYPVSPKKKIIYLAALILGLGFPVGIIYLIDLFKYRIENREDVERITKVPVIGEIPLGKKPSQGAIVIQENRNDMMEEVFRGVRTNLLFMLKPEDKVIMFTSTMPGEGKSFVAGNIAVSLAFMGKKVLIVGLDIRKPGLNQVFNLGKRVVGITNYLNDPEHTDLFDMIQHSDVSENLDILPGGPIPPNPTELVARTALEDAITELKKHYDYIILDTAPVGMVTDSALIARVANSFVYVCRADYTPKEGFAYINELKEGLKSASLSTVLNGIDMSSRKNSYGYGYGKKYGYGYGKRYGYGYGDTESSKK